MSCCYTCPLIHSEDVAGFPQSLHCVSYMQWLGESKAVSKTDAGSEAVFAVELASSSSWHLLAVFVATPMVHVGVDLLAHCSI